MYVISDKITFFVSVRTFSGPWQPNSVVISKKNGISFARVIKLLFFNQSDGRSRLSSRSSHGHRPCLANILEHCIPQGRQLNRLTILSLSGLFLGFGLFPVSFSCCTQWSRNLGPITKSVSFLISFSRCAWWRQNQNLVPRISYILSGTAHPGRSPSLWNLNKK